jgi:hypothetical protein
MDAHLLKKRYAIDIPDLPDQSGGINVVTIARWDTELYSAPNDHGVKEQRERHLLFFNEIRLPLRLNNTRIDVLIAILGPDMSRWPGRKVGLYVGATQSYGQTKAGVLLDIRAHDQAQPILPEHVRRGQLSGGAGGSPAGGWHRPPQGGFATPAAMLPGAPLDMRPLGPQAKAKLMDGLVTIGATVPNVEEWIGAHYPHLLPHIQGKDPHWWPYGVGPAIRSFLTSWPNAPVEAAPSPAGAAPAPTPPPVAPPPPPAPQAAQAAATPVPVPAVNFTAGTRPAPARPAAQGPVYEPVTEDDIPF